MIFCDSILEVKEIHNRYLLADFDTTDSTEKKQPITNTFPQDLLNLNTNLMLFGRAIFGTTGLQDKHCLNIPK